MLISRFDLVRDRVKSMRLTVPANFGLDSMSAGFALALWRVGHSQIMRTRDS